MWHKAIWKGHPMREQNEEVVHWRFISCPVCIFKLSLILPLTLSFHTLWVRKGKEKGQIIFLYIGIVVCVAYWPLTRPSCQKKKCTYVNNRCIRSKISGDQGWPWLSRGWIECEIVTLAGRRVGVKLLYNPSDRKFRSIGEKILEWEPGPWLSSTGEQERNTVLAIRVGVNMLQFCSVSNTPLTQ